MDESRIHVQTLFQHIQPEMLLKAMLEKGDRHEAGIDSTYVSMDCYMHAARSAFPERSDDELMQLYWELEEYMRECPMGGFIGLLADCAKEFLCYHGGEPYCRQERLLEWRELTLALGQDLLVCAWLARKDVKDSCRHKLFYWPAAIQTNDPALKSVMAQGISENHFHLNGSTQGFPLTWGFLMNHPKHASRYFKDRAFRDNLHPRATWGAHDNVIPWENRIYYASWLRAILFSELQSGNAKNNLAEFHRALDQKRLVCQLVETIRFDNGARLVQFGGRGYCLDYAIDPLVDQHEPTRFLTGERQFLYECFHRCYSGRFSRPQMDELYLYLLIKHQFRNEIVQTNLRYGFRNFSAYDGRKAKIWGWNKEYWFEANNIAVKATLQQPIQSLEMRIVPGQKKYELFARVDVPDQVSQLNLHNPMEGYMSRKLRAMEQTRSFFVLHFAKRPLPRVDSYSNSEDFKLRHGKFRNQIERQSKMIAACLERSSYLCSRIRGIDAASHEIGCRPEIFATSFRFLRNFPVRTNLVLSQERYWPTLGASYHAGEDFLDISDGLRAIDEAICFLNLSRGDRIGHALALGIEPEAYYHLKNHRVYLPAQDLLDNLVWLLYRSLEWDVAMPDSVRCRLNGQAEKLFREIYGRNCSGATLLEYYQSWTLRGDSPELYFFGGADDRQFQKKLRLIQYSASRFDPFRVNDHIWNEGKIENNRACARVRKLVYYYQYGSYEQWQGQKSVAYTIEPGYIQLIRKLQDHMMQKIMATGICIECNPSSNYLIGTFRQYHKHPLFRFNSHNLDIPGIGHSNIQLQVSINTDDQSIFDTSLEYEYALIYASMKQHMDDQGIPLISSDSARTYLDHVRGMGNAMAFQKAAKQYRSHFMA